MVKPAEADRWKNDRATDECCRKQRGDEGAERRPIDDAAAMETPHGMRGHVLVDQLPQQNLGLRLYVKARADDHRRPKYQ